MRKYSDEWGKREKIEFTKRIGEKTRQYLYDNNFIFKRESYQEILNNVANQKIKDSLSQLTKEEVDYNIKEICMKVYEYVQECYYWKSPDWLQETYEVLCDICEKEVIPKINNYQVNYYISNMCKELGIENVDRISNYKYKSKEAIKWIDTNNKMHDMNEITDESKVKYWIYIK